MFLANKLNKGAGVPTPVDAQFNYVTMLLHGDGTNGAQNNTFLDSSTNNFTITRNGNTTQGSFSPYGSNWSNFFDGSGDWLSTASTSALAFGTGDFTLEAWVYPLVNQTGFRGILSAYDGAGPVIETSGNYWAYYFVSSGVATSTLVVPNTWTHVALTRSGTTGRMFVNGVLAATVTDSTNYSTNSTVTVGTLGGGLDAGYEFNGYISNARIVKGTAVYTSDFTPPTAPLTAISGTSFLGCANNRFVDDSASPLTITVNGNPSVQRFNPFGASTAYSTSVIGGSGYFDGSGDYLGVPYSANLTMTGDFTAECWVYVTSAPNAYGGILAFSNDSENVGWNILIGGTTTKFHFNVAMTYTDTATSITLNAWTHLALVRSGSTGKLYINGVADANTVTTSATATCPTNPQIGRYPLISDRNFFGYISNTRVIKGTAVYTSNFTPPTAPVTAITNTQLLLNTTNGAIFDNAMMNDLETVGNAQISTSVKKYGTGSMAFDGTGDYLLGASNPNMSFGAGDFTTEAWVYRTASPGGNQTIFQKGRTADSNLEFTMLLSGSNFLSCFYTTDGSTAVQPFSSTTAVALNTWTHIAVTRSGSTWRCFVNGTLEATTTAAVTLYTGTGLISSGSNPIGDNPFTGYIDDLRITKGYARYTTTFTPPTAAFPNTGPI